MSRQEGVKMQKDINDVIEDIDNFIDTCITIMDECSYDAAGYLNNVPNTDFDRYVDYQCALNCYHVLQHLRDYLFDITSL